MTKGCKIILCAAVSAMFAGCATPDSELSALPLHCPSAIDSAAPVRVGCVNKANLANMTSEPHDLEEGGELRPADGAKAALIVEAYKQGKIKELPASDSTTSNSAN